MDELSYHFISVERNSNNAASILKEYKNEYPDIYNNDAFKNLIKDFYTVNDRMGRIELLLERGDLILEKQEIEVFQTDLSRFNDFLVDFIDNHNKIIFFENNFNSYLSNISSVSEAVNGFIKTLTSFERKCVSLITSDSNSSVEISNDDIERIYFQSKALLDNIHTEYQGLLAVTAKLNNQQEKLDELEARYRKSLVQFNVDEERYKEKKSIIEQSEEISSKFLAELNLVTSTIADITTKYDGLNNTVTQLSASTNTLSDILNEKLKKIDAITKQANEVLNSASTVAVGGHFKQQYDDSKKHVLWWPILGALFLLGAIAICVLTVFPEIMRAFSDSSLTTGKSNELKFIISRLVVAPLFLVGAWFCANQYVKQKNIIEDYAYKKVLSLSLLSIKSEIEKTGEQNTTEFIRAVQNEILRSPLDALDRKHLKNEVKFLKMVQSEVMQNILKGASQHKRKKEKSN